MGKLTHWAVIFSLLALAYGVLAFSGGAGTASSAAELLFWSALAGVVVSSIGSLLRRT